MILTPHTGKEATNMKIQRFPNYTIGEDAYTDIVGVCAPYGTKAAVIGGNRALAAALPGIEAAVAGSPVQLTGTYWNGGEASVENIERLEAEPGVQQADMIFAVGGGKAIDTAKVLSHRAGKPLFTFPTIASTCASCTGLGILYHPDGSLREYSFSDVPPVHIFIDTGIIARAPRQYLWAGIGDSMAKYYECTVSGRGDELDHPKALGTAISHMCGDPLVKYGVQALADCDANRVTDALEEIVLGIIVSTGYVSNLVNIDLTTGAAHAMYNGFTVLPQIEHNGHLHGEIVAYGVLVLLAMDEQEEELQRIHAFSRKMGLPTCLADLHCTTGDLDKVITKALAGIDVRHYPYTVTPELIRTAVARLEQWPAEEAKAV